MSDAVDAIAVDVGVAVIVTRTRAERAAAAAPHPWRQASSRGFTVEDAAGRPLTVGTTASPGLYVAMMHPGVGLALSALLGAVEAHSAECREKCPPGGCDVTLRAGEVAAQIAGGLGR